MAFALKSSRKRRTKARLERSGNLPPPSSLSLDGCLGVTTVIVARRGLGELSEVDLRLLCTSTVARPDGAPRVCCWAVLSEFGWLRRMPGCGSSSELPSMVQPCNLTAVVHDSASE